MTERLWLALVLCAGLVACAKGSSQPQTPPKTEPPDAHVKALADTFLDAFFDRNPEAATVYGVPGRRHDRLTDNSLAALRAWQAKEDGWLQELRSIDAAAISGRPLRATYAIVRQSLEGNVAKRVCRDELWPVSQMTGWQVNDGYLVTIQPVGTEELRREALARWGALPKYIDTEIESLREGIKAGYTAPKLNVRIVIDQVRTLATTPLKDSPFGSPIQRDKDPAFQKAFTALVNDAIVPAATRYADFLEREYLPAAREALGVTANPNGAACYDASVLYHASIPKTAREVHELGVQQNEQLTAEMKAIGQRSFQIDDVPKLLQEVRSNPRYKFKSREEK